MQPVGQALLLVFVACCIQKDMNGESLECPVDHSSDALACKPDRQEVAVLPARRTRSTGATVNVAAGSLKTCGRRR